MRRFSMFVFTILFILTMALPAMAQDTPNNSPVQRTTVEGATFYGQEGSINFYANLYTDYENQDQYILYVEKSNYENNGFYYGRVTVPKSDVVFNTNKGTVTVSKTVDLIKVEWVTPEIATAHYEGYESINLTWSFNPQDGSYHKSVDRNIKTGSNEYLQLGSSTYKDYNNITVSGKIDDMDIVDFDYTGAYVYTATSFSVIKK